MTHSVVANSPAPAAIPFPDMVKRPDTETLDAVLQVLRNEGASAEMIIAVKELTIPC